MTSACALALALAVLTGAAAHAQTKPAPTDAPPAQAPWPGNAKPAQPMAMPVQTGPMMGGGPPPTAEQQTCLRDFAGYREEVEKRAMAAKASSEKKVTREEMCMLVMAYSDAEAKWIKYADDNMATCSIPPQTVEQIKSAHTRTLDTAKNLCVSGSPFRDSPPTRLKYMRISGRPQQ